MSSFESVVNCIILVCLPVIFAVLLGDEQETTVSNTQDSTGVEQRAPFSKNVSAYNCSAPCHASYPCHDELRCHRHCRNLLVQGMICSCDLDAHRPPLRDDYLITPGIGMHKFHSRSVTWNDARRTCYDEGGHLAIINSNAEAGVLTAIFNRASSSVKGAAYPDEAFLGIHDLYAEGNWVTILGDTLAKTGFSTWSERWGGQPDNGGGNQNCGAYLREGTLDDVHCEARYPFFCEIPLEKTEAGSRTFLMQCKQLREQERRNETNERGGLLTKRAAAFADSNRFHHPSPRQRAEGVTKMSNSFVDRVILVIGMMVIFDPLSSRSAPAPNPYSLWNSRCYKLHTKIENWARARRACILEGAHLVVINNKEEADMLKGKFHEKDEAVGASCQDAVFVGIHDQFDERDWVTIFDEPIATVFNEWSDKWGVQPDNFGGHQNCGTLYRDGKLNDVPCTMKLPFFCEKESTDDICS
ncbi:uncharacterized protein LOC117225762 [Megalopta genalis]|uniref:uncharacterized protein LOC117225762 n=1 Tax=Megalopta genalis TaxID=115081 RepID=UPI003FD6397B